jgi:hypothetical protein
VKYIVVYSFILLWFPLGGVVAQKTSISLLTSTNQVMPAEVLADTSFLPDSLEKKILPDTMEPEWLLKPPIESLLPEAREKKTRRIFPLIIRSLYPFRIRLFYTEINTLP